MTNRLKKWLRRGALTIAILLVVYTVLGFLVLPWVVRKVAVPKLGEALGREVRLEQVSFNPFLFRARLAGFEVLEPDGTPFVGFAEASADLEVTRLVGGTVWVRNFALVEPIVRIGRAADGRLNFADIVERLASDEPPPETEETKPPRFLVADASIIDARFEFHDATVDPPFETVVAPLTLQLTNLGTLEAAENQVSFDVARDEGFEIDWDGTFDPGSLRSEGIIRLTGLRVGGFDPYLARDLGFRVEETVLSAEVPYRLDLGDTENRLEITDGLLKLEDLKLRTRDEAEERFFEVGLVEVAAVNVSFGAQSIATSGITIQDGFVLVRQEEKGGLNLVAVTQPRAADDAPGDETPSSPPPTEDTPAATGPSWTFKSERVGVTNFLIRVEDRKLTTPFDTELRVESFAVTPVSSRPEEEMHFEAVCRIGEEGELDLNGRLRLEPMEGEISFDARSIALPLPQPYLAEVLEIEVTQGVLGADGTVFLQAGEGAPLRVEGNLEASQLLVHDPRHDMELFGLERFTLQGLAVDTGAKSVAVERIEFAAPALGLVVDTNGALNVTTLTRAGEEAQEEPPDAAEEPAPEGEAPPSWAIDIGELRLDAGTVRFVDQRLDPPAETVISELSAAVLGYATDADAQTDLEVTGQIDPFADFTITGRFYPAAFGRDTSLDVRTLGIALPPLSGYAQQYIGQGLDGGNLGLELKYRVADRELHGENRILVQDLALGEASDDPDAPDLPIGMAVSVLQDRQGRIVLDVPVSGNIDDVSFDIGGVITKALTGSITKIATSPLSIVGSVFGGGEDQDLSRLAFVPGTDRPKLDEHGKLDVIVRALTERPGLSLQVAGRYAVDSDSEPLAREALREHLQALQAEAPRLPQGSLDNDDVYAALVTEAYNRSAKGSTTTPAAAAHLDAPGPAPETSPRNAAADRGEFPRGGVTVTGCAATGGRRGLAGACRRCSLRRAGSQGPGSDRAIAWPGHAFSRLSPTRGTSSRRPRGRLDSCRARGGSRPG